jgi:hypothetical protein
VGVIHAGSLQRQGGLGSDQRTAPESSVTCLNRRAPDL